jgi:hypothetical protein
MKIHIDTGTPEEKAKADTIAQKGAAAAGKKPSPQKKGASSSTTKKPGASPSSGAATAPAAPAPVQPKPIPKGPPAEPKAPPAVAAARQKQSATLKVRQQKETRSNMTGLQGPSRDVDAGPNLGYSVFPTV